MGRREFVAGSAAFMLANTLPATDSNAFWWFRFLLGRGALGRHMMRFGRVGGRLRYAGSYSGLRLSRGIGRSAKTTRQKVRAKEILSSSRNLRLIKNIGELVYDNAGNNFSAPLDGNVSVVGGG